MSEIYITFIYLFVLSPTIKCYLFLFKTPPVKSLLLYTVVTSIGLFISLISIFKIPYSVIRNKKFSLSVI